MYYYVRQLEMANLSVEEKINLYLKKNPALKTKDRETILSVMVKTGELSLSEAEKISAFSKTEIVRNDKGTSLEHSNKFSSLKAEPAPVTVEQAQNLSIEYLSENLQSAIDIFRKMDNGVVSSVYDSVKNVLNTEFSSKNVGEVLRKEQDGLGFLVKAKEGSLTRREYYQKNKERLKEMILSRFNRQDDTGISYLEKFRGNYSKEDFTKILEEYITQTIDTISSMKGIKDAQHKLILQEEQETEAFMTEIAEKAKLAQTKDFLPEGQNKKLPHLKPAPHPYDSEELMTFGETFELERGTKFSSQSFELLQQSKGELSFATGAYNKTQQLRNNVKMFLDEYSVATKAKTMADGTLVETEEPLAEKRAAEISSMFTEYYASAPEMAQKELETIITKQKLDLKISENSDGALSIEFGELYKDDKQKNRAVNTLLKISVQEQEKKLNRMLGGKSYESYLEKYQQDYCMTFGRRNADELAKAMREDQMTVVDKYSGIASMAGLGLMAAGGVVMITPASPLGSGMVAAGGKIAMAGIVAKNAFGFTEELTRDEVSEDRMTMLKKNLAMDLGGLIIGGAAGRQGLKYASQILQNGGNKAFAILAEKGTDFTLSAAGDLAMIGALDYDESLSQTLKNNGIGIIVSTLTGIKGSKELFKNEFPKTLMPSVLKNDNSREVLLEGGIKASELNETAPFAKRLDERHDAGDYINVPEAKQNIKDLNTKLSSLKNDSGVPFNKIYPASSFADKFGAGNLPELSKFIDEMQAKYSDDNYVASILSGMLHNKGFNFEENLHLLRKCMTKFDDSKENQSAMTHLIWILDSNSSKAAGILLDLPKRAGNSDIPWSNLKEIVDKAEDVIDEQGAKALERAFKIKDENENYVFSAGDLQVIDNIKSIIADKDFTDAEIIKFINKKSDFDFIGDISSVANVITSKKNPALKLKLKDYLADSVENLAKNQEFISEVTNKVLSSKINAITDKRLKSFVKRNLNKIKDPERRFMFLDKLKHDFQELSKVKDSYITGKIYSELGKFAEAMNDMSEDVDWLAYYDITRYLKIDKELNGENFVSYGNASEYLDYMMTEYPDEAITFMDLAKKYTSMTPQEYSKYVDDNIIKNSDYYKFYVNVPNYVKDKKIQNLKLYFMRSKINEADPNCPVKDKRTIRKLYKEKFLPLLPEAVREKCEKIYDSFGVKMFISDSKDTEALDYVYNELLEWQKAGKGKAVFPAAIDLSNIQQQYIDKIFDSGGFYSKKNNVISVKSQYFADIVHAIRHEIAHANDSKKDVTSGIITVTNKDGTVEEIDIDKIIVHKQIQKRDENGRPMFNPDGTPVTTKALNSDLTFVPDLEKCLYVNEFENAGIPIRQIKYAYTKKADFVAVAAEGDYSKYSKEFKDLLVKLGLPEWVFAMKPKNNVSSTLNSYPKNDFTDKFTSQENQKIYENTEKFFNNVAKNQAEVYKDYQKFFGSDLQCRVKDFKGLNEKIYRQINKLDKKIEDLSDVEKYNLEKLKPGDEPLTREAAEVLIEKYTLQKENLINDYDTVYSTIQDAFGARLILEDGSAKSVGKVHQSLLEAIDNGEIKLLEINNYQGEGSIPYFTSAQIKQLQAHCRRQGYELKVISSVNAPAAKENSYQKLYNQQEAVKKSGYTTCQMNILHKNGVVSEFQIRGKYINELAESEHIYYDLSEGKDISKGNPAIKELTDPLKNAVADMNKKENSHIKAEYSKYLTSCYKYARMKELGIPMEKPVLPPSVNKLLDIENIIAIHEKIASIK